MAKRSSSEFRVPFTGLKLGKHEFEFALGNMFFEAFDYSEIEKADIAVYVTLDKQSTMMVLDFSLEGEVELPCDRCGDLLHQPIEGDYKLIVKLGDRSAIADDDVLVLGTSESDLDLAHHLYEFTHLSLPARRVHHCLNECNQEMLATIDKYRIPNPEPDDFEDTNESEEE